MLYTCMRAYVHVWVNVWLSTGTREERVHVQVVFVCVKGGGHICVHLCLYICSCAGVHVEGGCDYNSCWRLARTLYFNTKALGFVPNVSGFGLCRRT